MLLRALLIVSLLGLNVAQAEEVKTGLTNESELGYVITGGNSESESTSVKQKSVYTWTKDILQFTGHYLQSSGQVQTGATPADTENRVTAENWSAILRLERVLSPNKFNMYISHGWNGDRFQNIDYAHNTGIGGKYFWKSTEKVKFFSELGYEYKREFLTNAPANTLTDAEKEKVRVGSGHVDYPEYHYARIYTQFDCAHSKTFAFGAWVEYLPSITDFQDDQRINYSPYLTSVLTDMFSLKVAYEGRYRFKPAAEGNKLTDYTFTTSLLAKF